MTLLAKDETIYVAGSSGMAGNAICKLLSKQGYTHQNRKLLTSSRKDLDLRDPIKVEDWFGKFRPQVVIIAAARVGGIKANNEYPAEFIFDNLLIQANIIDSCHVSGVKKMLFLFKLAWVGVIPYI